MLDLQGGSLNLGGHDFTVSGDYRNAAFGAGNAFDARANVSGAGAILAAGDVTLGIGGDSVTFDGDGDRYVLNFQDIRVGSTETRSFIVRNDGSDGPALRGALQTAVNGGNVTSPALSGPGVTAQNFGPIATGDGESFDVTYAPTEAGVLTGQQVFVDTNFDNVDGETVAFEARGILAAAGTLSATSLDFGSVRTTDPAPVQTIDVTNTTAAGPFSEALGIGIDDAGSGDFAVADTDLGAAIAAGTTASNRIQVTLDNSTAGTKTGSFEVAYSSLPIAGSNLAAASVGGDTVALSGIVTAMDVFQTAIPEFDPEPLDFGVHRVGSGDVVRTLTVTNAAVGEEGFVDRLAGTLAVAAGSTPPFSGDGDLGGGLESLESTGIDFTLATDTAGSFNGAIEAALSSENDTMDPLALDVPPLVMTGQVNNLANPGFAFGGGDGLFQGLGGGRFVLDFGTVDIADGPVSAELLVTNEFVFVGAPQDNLGGSFTVGGDIVFATLGFDAFAGLAAGNSIGGFEITLDPQATGVGTYTSFIGLLGLSTFAGLPDLSPEELELALGYLPELEVNVVVTPLPASVWFLGSALAALGAAAARRRRAQAQAEAQAQVVAA
ncbi:MAG: VPLPA-CTERM sorting domain-containing protein [Rhodospirillales bacterium]|nr:MAG: VPLPA-CTERM sorting domain-containing protein [Rhodospirillales bacterium]